ncbi:alpha/beta hydrolase [Uliginosibacterium aquaticum]|uniref:Alpha/beta fold hydrolase n=1 Tax=Uliginosibacterium aquaticum TaxID=2731212 RepID=A0ABX2IFK4_9RHOO|nr:alpha/beta fold hydrolase [Uliginosibacterium aquaticum]NSL55469.1 alpha/beta fold hydrolase [Uliginosibacterium aquaticum]
MDFPCLIRRPETPPQHRPPLLVLLHGKGANEEDLFSIARHTDPRFVVASLRAPHEMAPGYYRWYERTGTPQGSVFDEAEIEASRIWLVQAVNDLVMGLGADRRQVHLFGFSQGAAMALAMALTSPQHVRSVVSIAGRLLRACAPLAAPPSALAHLSVLLQHGSQDDLVPHAESALACQLFAELGVKQGFKSYHAGHTISPAMLKDALDFLRVQLDADTPSAS